MNQETDASEHQTKTIEQAIERGKQHHTAGDLTQAERIYQQILQSDPHQPDALHLLGVIALQLGKNDKAADLIAKALTLKPDFAKAHNNLGLALQGQGKLDEALASFQKALALVPDFAKAHYNLGVALDEAGKLDEAGASYRNAISADPDFAEAHFLLGKVLKRRDELSEAIASYRQALSINPDLAEAHNNLGNALKHQGAMDEALACYRQALLIKPDFVDAHSNLLAGLNYETGATQTDIIEEAREWDRRHASAFAGPPNHDNDRAPDRRIRIGYVSPDMRRHSVSYFFEPLLAAHDSSVVETFCYADVATPDATTRCLEGHADHWRMTIGMDDQTMADTIRADGIDILVDLAGHTAKNRLLVFARRPSPVQVTWLGYPNTTGLTAMDYRLVDSITDPANEASETLFRLPNGFLCYQPADEAPSHSSIRAAGPLTFGSFNKANKMSTSCIKLWARILTEVPESRLLLKSGQFADTTTQELVRAKFAAYGIAAERLDLHPHTKSLESHLELYAEVDVCLDPFPYNGTTTTCEALWMGVPVVTLQGDHHRERVGASILSRVGLDDCIAADADSYVSIAAGLARDTSRRMELRNEMRERMAPLCDAGSFARDMEAAFRSMWHTWCAADLDNL